MKIRKAKREDAPSIGAMLEEFCAYLRSIGDDTDFKCNAGTFLRDGFGKFLPLEDLSPKKKAKSLATCSTIPAIIQT